MSIGWFFCISIGWFLCGVVALMLMKHLFTRENIPWNPYDWVMGIFICFGPLALPMVVASFILTYVNFFIVYVMQKGAKNGRLKQVYRFNDDKNQLIKNSMNVIKSLVEEKDKLQIKNKEQKQKIKSLEEEIHRYNTELSDALTQCEQLKQKKL